MKQTPFSGIYAPCCEGPNAIGCACGEDERVLRSVIRKELPLTSSQKDWCIEEIASVEGHDREECEGLEDSALANLVLAAWTDYCRDKGLL